jgi:hypothetical protein
MIGQGTTDRRAAQNERAGLRMYHCSMRFDPGITPNVEGRNRVWLMMAERMTWNELQVLNAMSDAQLSELLFGQDEDNAARHQMAFLYDQAEERISFSAAAAVAENTRRRPEFQPRT